MPRLLLVDDDVQLTVGLSRLLELEGFQVRTAYDGQTALNIMRAEGAELVILDIGLPRLTGREVCRTLRREGITTPILMLTISPRSRELVGSFADGADDYLDKPFDEDELVARIRGLLRRVQQGGTLSGARRLASGQLVLDRAARLIWLENKVVPAGPKATAVLEQLMLNRGQVLTRERLLQAVWGGATYLDPRIVDARVLELRRGLNDERTSSHFIVTRVGGGYMFGPPVEGLP